VATRSMKKTKRGTTEKEEIACGNRKCKSANEADEIAAAIAATP